MLPAKGIPEGDKAQGNKANKELWEHCKFFGVSAGEILLHDSQTFRYPWNDVVRGTLQMRCNILRSLESVYGRAVAFTYFSERTFESLSLESNNIQAMKLIFDYCSNIELQRRNVGTNISYIASIS